MIKFRKKGAFLKCKDKKNKSSNLKEVFDIFVLVLRHRHYIRNIHIRHNKRK